MPIVLAMIATGCSPIKRDRISVGDSMQASRAKLVAWGGQETYLARYTVTVPPTDNAAEPTVHSAPYIVTVPNGDEDQSRGTKTEQYEVVDPRTHPCDGYSFHNRIVVLHGDETVADIEIIFNDDGFKSTRRSDYGNRVLARSDLVQ